MDLTEADWDRIHRVNAKGVFFCLQRVAREMIPRRSGRIINIASIAGKGYDGTSNAAYAASKGAVISLTKTAAQQLAQAQHQRQLGLPGRDAHRAVGRQPAGRARSRKASASRRWSAAAPQVIPLKRANDPEDIAAHGGVPRLAGRAQHHRPVLQRRWRADSRTEPKEASNERRRPQPPDPDRRKPVHPTERDRRRRRSPPTPASGASSSARRGRAMCSTSRAN